ncbi:MAG: leucine-rich repeat domain-containing protein [Candidatus Hydrogenedentes bacterium]|nr:leucine-rich repeat domain-containing protein [Candidatus Hydrogenedentota bacterium]
MDIRGTYRLGMAVALVVAAALGTGCPSNVAIVSIPDAALEAAIRDELGLPLGFLTRGDLLRLRQLDVHAGAKAGSIRDLTGLENATNLTFLDVSGNPIADISAVASLVNLLSLNIDGTDVFELSPLAGLINLDSLSACGTLVTDIQPLVTNSVNGGLGTGDFVNLSCSALGDQANDFDIPFLETAGVNVVCCGSS